MTTATPLLDTVNLPEDLRRLPADRLPQLAAELRGFLLEACSRPAAISPAIWARWS